MPKVWVLDTETKGTGANMVPIDKVRKKAGPRKREPEFLRRRPQPGSSPEPVQEPEPSRPRRFKIVDVMTREVVAEDADTRTAIGVLERYRSVVDVDVFVWDRSRDRWRPVSMAEKRAVWGLRRTG